jgi:cell wall-associated NlpC family hydrolase
LHQDGQEGWIDAKMCTPMADKEYRAYKKACSKAATVIFPMAYAVSENNGQTIPLTAGTRLTNYQSQTTNGATTGRFEVLGVGFRIDPSMVTTAPLPMNQEKLLQTVRFFLNIPYLWGGKNAMGMDCSGFTQIILSLFGVSLPRNASEQIMQGRVIEDLSQAQAGDLVFFAKSPIANDQSPVITHVGIVIDPERVIHCSGRVKVEKLDQTGIYSAEQGAYTHHLAGIRRSFTR